MKIRAKEAFAKAYGPKFGAKRMSGVLSIHMPDKVHRIVTGVRHNSLLKVQACAHDGLARSHHDPITLSLEGT